MWTPLPTDKARKEVNKRRPSLQHVEDPVSFRKWETTPARPTRAMSWLMSPSKPTSKTSETAFRALGDGRSLGDFSLSIVLHGESKRDLDQLAGEFTSVFTNADGNLFTETYNQLNAYFATVPGNYALNLRKLYLLNSNYADLSFLFTILPGERRNAHLGTEYLAVLETENSTPLLPQSP